MPRPSTDFLQYHIIETDLSYINKALTELQLSHFLIQIVYIFLALPLTQPSAPPDPTWDLAFRRQCPKPKVGLVIFRLFPRRKLDFKSGQHDSGTGNHLLLREMPSRAESWRPTEWNPTASQTFETEPRCAPLIYFLGSCSSVAGLQRTTGGIIGVDEEAVCPELVKRMRIGFRTCVPNSFIQCFIDAAN